MKQIIKKLSQWLLSRPIAISIVAFIILSIIVGYLDIRFLRFNNLDSMENLLAEVHGLLLDLLLFGIVLATFTALTEKNQKIERYKEEIEDYRHWDEKEAVFRIAGNIRRLNRLGVSNIDLSFCYLIEAKLDDVDLEGSNLFLAQLQGADLSKANLKHTNFQAAYLQNADLSCAQLKNANLRFARLQNAELYNADLEGADLRTAKLQGAILSRIFFKNNENQTAYVTLDDNGDIIRPEGTEFWTERANLAEAKLHGAFFYEEQRIDLMKTEVDISGVQFIAKKNESDDNESND